VKLQEKYLVIVIFFCDTRRAMKGNERLLTLTEAGSLLEREPSGLRKAIIAGELSATKYGKTWLVTESAVLAWNQSNPRSNAGRPAGSKNKPKTKKATKK
jgi:excisionase family DNA binding protein